MKAVWLAVAAVLLSRPLPSRTWKEAPHLIDRSDDIMARDGLRPADVWAATMNVRALATDGAYVWAATGGGVERYDRATHRRDTFGVAQGLDTLDAIDVRVQQGTVEIDTYASRCSFESADQRFHCHKTATRAPAAREIGGFRGHAVTARLELGSDAYIATRGGGLFHLHDERVTLLSDPSVSMSSFVHTAARFRDELWLGSFDDGLFRVPLEHGQIRQDLRKGAVKVATPFRMVNRLMATDDTLFVAAKDGVFSTRDGKTFVHMTSIHARDITGLATTRDSLWVASTEAVYRLARSGRGRPLASHVYPAGSHAIQDITADADDRVWLATEDRGVVRIDAAGPVAFDRLQGLPTSWFVAVKSDGQGGVRAASLRHGFIHVGADGSWRRVTVPRGDWGLAIARIGSAWCEGTQDGAWCEAQGIRQPFALLPDARVHAIVPLEGQWLVATEAGVAIYPRG